MLVENPYGSVQFLGLERRKPASRAVFQIRRIILDSRSCRHLILLALAGAGILDALAVSRNLQAAVSKHRGSAATPAMLFVVPAFDFQPSAIPHSRCTTGPNQNHSCTVPRARRIGESSAHFKFCRVGSNSMRQSGPQYRASQSRLSRVEVPANVLRAKRVNSRPLQPGKGSPGPFPAKASRPPFCCRLAEVGAGSRTISPMQSFRCLVLRPAFCRESDPGSGSGFRGFEIPETSPLLEQQMQQRRIFGTGLRKPPSPQIDGD